MQTPFVQVSTFVQALPSSHVSVLKSYRQRPPWQVSVVQGLWSSHCAGVVQGVQFETATCVHPEPGAHASVVQASWSSQSGAGPGVHTPPWQVSPDVHALPSSHGKSSGRVGAEQVPSTGLHVPAVWHWSGTGHATGDVPTHAPFRHTSTRVQALPSSQDVVLFVCMHWPAVQASVVHGFWSLHCATVVHGTQPGVATWVQPVVGLHASAVQALWSSQSTAAPGVQTPAVQTSPVVHALRSSHGVLSVRAGFEHVPVAGAQTPAPWHWSWAVQTTGALPTHVPP